MASPRWLGFLPLLCVAAADQAPPPSSVQIEGVTTPAAATPKQDEPAWLQGGGCDSAEPQIDPKGKLLGAQVSLRHRNLMAPNFAGGTGFYPLADKVEPGPANDALLQLRISGPSKLAAGKPLKLGLQFHNRTGQPIVVLRPNDGSLEHMRYPYYDLFLQDEKSGQVYRWAFQGGRCGNINPTKREDHVVIDPGSDRADVALSWADYLKSAPIPSRGTYRVWVAYRFCGYESRGLHLGKDQQMSGVFRGSVVSNALLMEAR